MITLDQTKAAGRHVLTAAASIVGTLAAVKVISGGDASSLQTSLDQISHGAAEVLAGITTIATVASASYAAISASPLWQLLRGSKAVSASPSLAASVPLETKQAMVSATDALPGVQNVIAVPEIADAVPSNSVQSMADVRVVAK